MKRVPTSPNIILIKLRLYLLYTSEVQPGKRPRLSENGDETRGPVWKIRIWSLLGQVEEGGTLVADVSHFISMPSA